MILTKNYIIPPDLTIIGKFFNVAFATNTYQEIHYGRQIYR